MIMCEEQRIGKIAFARPFNACINWVNYSQKSNRFATEQLVLKVRVCFFLYYYL